MPVYAIASNIISALGTDSAAHWQAVAAGKTAIRRYEDTAYGNAPFYASRIGAAQWQMIQARTQSAQSLTAFEQLALFSIQDALRQCDESIDLQDTVLILSTTKGNVELLGRVSDEKLTLHYSADILNNALGMAAKPIVVSHACASGVVALDYGLRMLQQGRYKHAIVVGSDRFSRFVLSGFQSFQAVADEPCRPFDAARKGINLGEAAATIILSSIPQDDMLGELVAGATSNDANHISGPSRTGEELAMAIDRTLNEAGITASQLDMVSAHGTATVYNDEMESKAFALAGLSDTPLHSFKGYVGHTLGAAGIVESAIVLEAMKRQTLIPSIGFEQQGTPQPLNITKQFHPVTINYALKTASGFGGCNAAIIWKR